jgi:antitoxin VapB
MAGERIAKLFKNGRSQAVRLPREFRFQGDSVRVRRVASGVLLEPMYSDAKEWFAAMDEFGTDPFPARVQPSAPKRDVFE